MMNIEIANRLVELRKKNGYSQEELANKIGISRQAVSKWERAESAPDTDNLIALSKLYQISLDVLLHTEDPQETLKSTSIDKPADSVNPGNRKYGMYLFPYPVVTVILFFVIGFTFKHWEYAWLIYFSVPVYYGIAEVIHRNKHT